LPFARPVKLYAPDALAVAVAVDAPVNLTVAPEPPDPLIVPEIENVCCVVALDVKLMPVTLAALTVATCDVGLNVNPVCVGVTVYAPFARPVKVNAPEAPAFVVAEPAPLRVIVVPEPPDPLIVPEIENVCAAVAVAVKFAPVMLAVVIDSARVAGLNVKPMWLAVIV
jgi:hypothetical protein